MSKPTGLTKEQLEDMYISKHMTMQEIGKAFGVTRQAVCKAIKRFAIDTSQAERFDVVCDKCGKTYNLQRKRYNTTTGHYCSHQCYHAHRASMLPQARPSRHQRRIARAVMEKHLGRSLQGKECIHHIDGDEYNNSIDNLMLFVNHSEHLRYHHQLRMAQVNKN